MIKVCISHTSFDFQVKLPVVPRVDEIVSIDSKEYRVWKVEHSISTTIGTNDAVVHTFVYVV